MLKSSTTKKGKWTRLLFFYVFILYVLMVSTLAFVFNIIFCSRESKFFTVKEFTTGKKLFHSQGIFPYLKNLSTVKKLFTVKNYFHVKPLFDTKILLFFTSKEVFYSQRKFSTKKFTWSRKFSTSKEVFYSCRKFFTKSFYLIRKIFHKQGIFLQSRKVFKKNLLNQENFQQTMKFSAFFLLDQVSFPQTKTF